MSLSQQYSSFWQDNTVAVVAVYKQEAIGELFMGLGVTITSTPVDNIKGIESIGKLLTLCRFRKTRNVLVSTNDKK